MEPAATQWAALVGHPATHSEAAQRIDAHVQVEKSGAIVFRYVLRAEMSRVRVPAAEIAGAAGRANDLWKHTCFEAFIVVAGTAGYYELNFAPSRRWALYRFDAYREGMASPRIGVAPEIAVRRFDDRLEVDATVQLRELSILRGAWRLNLSLTAVVEDDSGTLSYWALKHAPGKPDFHHPDGFVLELEL
jgi:hypothetical protein